jgi:hypothetical protein
LVSTGVCVCVCFYTVWVLKNRWQKGNSFLGIYITVIHILVRIHLYQSVMAYNNMRREAGTAPSHTRRRLPMKTNATGKLYGKSFATDESVLDRLVAGRAVAPRRTKRDQYDNTNNVQETKLSSLDRLVAGKSTYTRNSGSSYSRYDNKGIDDHTTRRSRGSAYNRYDNKGINDHTTRRPADYTRQSSSNRRSKYGHNIDNNLENDTHSRGTSSIRRRDKPIAANIPICKTKNSNSRSGKKRDNTSSSSTKNAVQMNNNNKTESSFDRLSAGRRPPRIATRGSRYSASGKFKTIRLGNSKSSTTLSKTASRRANNTRDDMEQKKKSSMKRNLSIDPSALSKMQEVDLTSPKSATLPLKNSLTSPLSASGNGNKKNRPHSPYLKYTRPPGRRRSSDTGNNKEESIKLEGIRPSRVKNGWGSKSPELVIDDEMTIESSVDFKLVSSQKSLKSNGRSRKTSPILKVGMVNGDIQSSPVKMVQKNTRNLPVRAKSLGSSSKSSNSSNVLGGGLNSNGKNKDDQNVDKTSISLKKDQNDSYNNRPQSRRSRQRPHSGTRMDLKRSNNRAPSSLYI